jgi:hypothetical protein
MLNDHQKKILAGALPLTVGAFFGCVALVGAAALVQLAVPTLVVGGVVLAGMAVAGKIGFPSDRKEPPSKP